MRRQREYKKSPRYGSNLQLALDLVTAQILSICELFGCV